MATSEKVLYTNNAFSTLASGINDVVTALSVQAGHGQRFPNPGAGECFIATLVDAAQTKMERVKVTARSVDTLTTIVRAQDGTTAQSWSAGDKVEIRWGKLDAEQVVQQDGRNLFAAGGGTADAITATFSPTFAALTNGMEVRLRAPGANTITNPTFSPDGLTAKEIVHSDNTALLVGSIPGVCEIVLRYNSTWDKWALISLQPKNFVGDSGSGGSKGLVPAPAAGDAAEDKFLSSDGTWKKTGASNFGLLKWGATDIPQNATNYASPLGAGPSSTEAQTEYRAPSPMSITQLRVKLNAAVPASQSVSFTLRKNGADTALTCTVTAGNTVAEDVANAVHYNEGDSISVKIVASASLGSTIDAGISAITKVFGADSGVNMALVFNMRSAGGQEVCGEPSSVSGIVVQARGQVPLPQCIVGPVFLRTGSGSLVVTVNKNGSGVSKSLTAQYPSTGGLDLSQNAFEENDLYHVWQNDGGPTGPLTGYSRVTDNLYAASDVMFTLFSCVDQTQGTTRYMGGYGHDFDRAVESEAQIPMPACTLTTLRVAASSAPPAGQTCTLTVRKNGVDTDLTVTIDSTNRVQSITGQAVAFAAGDLLSISSISSATTGTLSYNACVEFEP